MDVFAISAELVHQVGDRACPTCLDDYPERCRCGGLMHAEAEALDADGNHPLVTRCDRCRLSKDQLQSGKFRRQPG